MAADGYLYGPRANGQIVRIDWEAGVVTDVIASGLGFLTKGPIAEILLFPPLLAFAWLFVAGR